MKAKKLILNKKTVAHLTTNDMGQVQGGWSVESCGVSDNCHTDVICDSGYEACGCSGMCTITCVTVRCPY